MGVSAYPDAWACDTMPLNHELDPTAAPPGSSCSPSSGSCRTSPSFCESALSHRRRRGLAGLGRGAGRVRRGPACHERRPGVVRGGERVDRDLHGHGRLGQPHRRPGDAHRRRARGHDHGATGRPVHPGSGDGRVHGHRPPHVRAPLGHAHPGRRELPGRRGPDLRGRGRPRGRRHRHHASRRGRGLGRVLDRPHGSDRRDRLAPGRSAPGPRRSRSSTRR